jgi:DNA helicase HerA-like ATPase
MPQMNQPDQIAEDAIFMIGKVVAVDGRMIRVAVDKTKNTSHLLYKGELLKNISVGGYIKIIKGFTKIIAKVEGEYITEDKQFVRREYASEKEKISRTLNLSLLGFFKGDRFERGIKELPLIDSECFLLHKKEFEQVHNFIRRGDEAITIGALSLEKGQEIRVGVNGLFASHIGIFGNTGSGKSYTLAKIYRELFEKYKGKRKFKRLAKFFLIDFNGEYVDDRDNVIVDKKYKHIYKLSTRTEAGGDKFPITTETLEDPNFWVVFLDATEKTQTPFLRRSIDNDFLASRIADEDQFKTLISDLIFDATTKGDRNIERTIVINFLNDLKECLADNNTVAALLTDYRNNLQYHSAQSKFYYRRRGQPDLYSENPVFREVAIDAKTRDLQIAVDEIGPIDGMKLRIVLQYYNDIIKGYSNREHLAPLMKRLDRRIDDLKKVMTVTDEEPDPAGKNITIVSLKDVNIHMRKILPLLLCKQLYDQKKATNDDQNYLNLIVDEAHNILSEASERESEHWKDYRLETFEEIIKEGRKFGVFLTVASQRPADISPTIISQLHNYFVHRLINNEDIRAVERTISYLDKVSFEYLPILPTGTCILAGLLANVPVVVDIGKIEPKYEPKNKTITLVDKWG